MPLLDPTRPSSALDLFPARRGKRESGDAIRALVPGQGISLRALEDTDLPWLRDLYAGSRAEEMASVPWPDSAKRSFLDQQFALQHHHYMAHFRDSDFLAIEHVDGGPIGRYYLQRKSPEHLIVDICLFAESRGRGIGSLLIRQSQRDCAELGLGMCLRVQESNPAARRLYERLGFVTEENVGTHRLMRWSPSTSA